MVDIFQEIKGVLSANENIGFTLREPRSYPFKRLYCSTGRDQYDPNWIDHSGGEQVIHKETFFVFPHEAIPENLKIFSRLNNLLVDVLRDFLRPQEIELACNTSNDPGLVVVCPATAVFKSQEYQGKLTYKYEITRTGQSTRTDCKIPKGKVKEIISPFMLRVKVVFFPSEQRVRMALQAHKKRFNFKVKEETL